MPSHMNLIKYFGQKVTIQAFYDYLVNSHLPPTASISSKKMIQAFFVLAISNNSLTILAPLKLKIVLLGCITSYRK